MQAFPHILKLFGTVSTLSAGPLFAGTFALATPQLAQAALYEYESGHGHPGLHYGVNPPDPRDRINGNTAPEDREYPGLNPDGGMFPHVGVPKPNNTNLPVPGPYGPDQVDFIVPATTIKGRPSGTEYDALGNSAGNNTWILPESQTEASNQNAPWIGPAVNPDAFSQFEDMDGDSQTEIVWQLTDVEGPGNVALWTNDQFGNPDFWMASSDGLDGNDAIDLGSGGAHNFWSFTEAGEYDLTWSWTGQHGTDGEVSESATYAFNVVPEPTSAALLGLGGLALVRRRRQA
jgi:surface-anchored protein